MWSPQIAPHLLFLPLSFSLSFFLSPLFFQRTPLIHQWRTDRPQMEVEWRSFDLHWSRNDLNLHWWSMKKTIKKKKNSGNKSRVFGNKSRVGHSRLISSYFQLPETYFSYPRLILKYPRLISRNFFMTEVVFYDL